MSQESKRLRAERAQIVADARKLIEAPDAGAEAHAKFDELMAKADAHKATIDRMERAEAADLELAETLEIRAEARGISTDELQEQEARNMRVFQSWMRNGMEGLQGEDRRLAASQIRNAQGVGSGAAGGYTVPAAFMADLLVRLKAFGGMREVARQIDTQTGADLPWPTLDDTSQIGEILPENTQISTQDVAFNAVTLKGYLYTSKLVPVSWQLLQDSAFDVPALLRDVLTTRIGRVTNTHFTVGTGTAQPQGAVTGATLGATGAGGQLTTITYADLVELEFSVDPAYLPGSRYMMNSATLKAMRKLVDTTGRPIWAAGISVGAPDTINGYPYTINQDMPVPAANAKSVLFGNFQNYAIRNVRDMQLVRLNERYADYLQTGFFAYGRWDGRVISAGQPLKYFQHAAA